jgi:4,5-DOPA dioxygenase extradiol
VETVEDLKLPTLFVSHGAPTLPLEDIPARRFLAGLGERYPDARAVLCISAHWATSRPTVNASEKPETIHDFSGFPRELYGIEYPVRGSEELAGRVATLLEEAGVACDIDRRRGLDHGTWVPLLLMFPAAEVPVAQLSIQYHLDPSMHLALGRAIAPLRHEGVLVMGSGGAVHPLGYAPLGPGMATDGWAMEFDTWLEGAVTAGDVDGLVAMRERAPYPERAHPSIDHYVPLLAAMGAAGSGATGRTLHRSWQWGDLSMAAYEFDR